MRVAVLGANGLLGCNLVRVLGAAGHEVHGLVRATSDLRGLDGVSYQRHEGDVRDQASVRAAIDGCEWVFHGAAVFAYSGFSERDMYETAEQGSRAVIDACRDARVRRVVLTSSTAVLGGDAAPTPRDEATQLDLAGTPDYFRSKRLQESTALERAREQGVELVVANPSAFIGRYDFKPGAALPMVTSYLTAPIGVTLPGGINLLHAEDVAKGHLLLANKGTPGERHILCGENHTYREIHNTISALMGLRPPRFEATRASSYVAGALMELGSKLTGKPALATRELAQQVGNYFWYRGDKCYALGFEPRSARETLVDVLAWLLDSPLLTEAQKRKLRPAPEVLAARTRPAAR